MTTIVYQMAKVGSTSVVEALQRAGIDAHHVHRMNRAHLRQMRAARRANGWIVLWIPRHDRHGIRLHDTIIQQGLPVKIVSLVRDPIARNLSSYFEHLDFIWHTRHAYRRISMGELHRGFLERFTHDDVLTWFDDELKPVLGIDAYEHPITDRVTIHKHPIELLIFKTELSDHTKSEALSEFFERPITLSRANETGSKEKGMVYRRFVDSIRLPREYVERMLTARYTTHFYSDAEREEMRSRWSY